MIELSNYIENEMNNKFLMEMAQIGQINPNLTIFVRSNDGGNIPHFHIVDKTTLGDKFHTCVKIETNEYFHHTGKEDKLNSKQRKELDSFLRKPFKKKSFSNWDFLLMTWNSNNSKIEVDDMIEQPNYTIIKENN